jgi:DNA-binding GntR family transcriptional regulator
MEVDYQASMQAYLPLREVVFHTLRQAILKGELQPGERLMEVALAKDLGVSRTPIREAIRKLELEGLVLMVPRRGAQVAEITEKSLRDVLEVRGALEELAVTLACSRMDPQEAKELRKAAKVFEESLAQEDVTTIAEADVAFHDVIYQATKNQKLLQLASNLREQMYRYRVEYLKHVDSYEKLVEEHEQLMNALDAKNEVRALEVTKQHIGNQERAVLASLRLRQLPEKSRP